MVGKGGQVWHGGDHAVLRQQDAPPGHDAAVSCEAMRDDDHRRFVRFLRQVNVHRHLTALEREFIRPFRDAGRHGQVWHAVRAPGHDEQARDGEHGQQERGGAAFFDPCFLHRAVLMASEYTCSPVRPSKYWKMTCGCG